MYVLILIHLSLKSECPYEFGCIWAKGFQGWVVLERMIKLEFARESRFDEERTILGGRQARMAADLRSVHV